MAAISWPCDFLTCHETDGRSFLVAAKRGHLRHHFRSTLVLSPLLLEPLPTCLSEWWFGSPIYHIYSYTCLLSRERPPDGKDPVRVIEHARST